MTIKVYVVHSSAMYPSAICTDKGVADSISLLLGKETGRLHWVTPEGTFDTLEQFIKEDY